jgi:hypothetical protein
MDLAIKQKASALRMTGLSIAAISRETGITARRLDYLFTKEGIRKSDIAIDEIKKAVGDVRNCEILKRQLQDEIKLLIRTELAQSSEILDHAAILLCELKGSSGALSLEKQANILSKLTDVTEKATSIIRRAANSQVVYPNG